MIGKLLQAFWEPIGRLSGTYPELQPWVMNLIIFSNQEVGLHQARSIEQP